MQLKPLSDHLIVKAVKPERLSASGIIIPETVDKDRPERGEVIAVGPGKRVENGTIVPVSVTVGQVVLFKKYAPDEIKVDGQEFLVIKEDDVMAVIES